MKGRYLEDTSRPWNQETRTKILQRPPVHFLVPLISKAQSKGNIVILFNLFTCVCVHMAPFTTINTKMHMVPPLAGTRNTIENDLTKRRSWG